ncbi:hypothetical protein D3C81_1758750 [compost metagenome]
MQSGRFDQGLVVALALGEGVQIPAALDHADLEHDAGAGATGRLVRLQVEPALLEGAAIGAEDGLEGEGRGARQRMPVDEQGVVHAVELHRRAKGDGDDLRRAFDVGDLSADG